MPLLSVSLHPNHVEFDGDGLHEKFPTTGKSCVFEIGHRHGKLEVAVRNGELMLGWPQADRMIPNMSATTTYRRIAQQFYPEILISVSGYIEIAQRHQ